MFLFNYDVLKRCRQLYGHKKVSRYFDNVNKGNIYVGDEHVIKINQAHIARPRPSYILNMDGLCSIFKMPMQDKAWGFLYVASVRSLLDYKVRSIKHAYIEDIADFKKHETNDLMYIEDDKVILKGE